MEKTNLNQIYQQAKKLFLEKKWKEALSKYQIIFNNYKDQTTIEHKLEYATTLLNTNNITEAKNLTLKLYENDNNNLKIKNLLANILFTEILNNQKKLPLNKILQLIEQIKNVKPSYFLESKIIIQSAKILLNKNYTKKALEIIINHDKKKLSDKPLKLKDGKILPSQKETFFLLATKLFIANNIPQKAIKTVDYVMKKINITPTNKTWFILYKADALKATKQYQESIKYYMQINKQKELWFINFRIAEILLILNKKDIAFSYALKAVLDKKQKTWFKINVFNFILNNFPENFSDKQLNKLATLIAANYIKKGFNENKNLLKILKNFNIKINSKINIKELEKEIYQIMQNLYYGKEYNGLIINIFKHFGFVKETENKIFFFFSNVEFDKKILRKNLKVKFHKIWSYDYKKNKFVVNAVKIKLIK